MMIIILMTSLLQLKPKYNLLHMTSLFLIVNVLPGGSTFQLGGLGSVGQVVPR